MGTDSITFRSSRSSVDADIAPPKRPVMSTRWRCYLCWLAVLRTKTSPRSPSSPAFRALRCLRSVPSRCDREANRFGQSCPKPIRRPSACASGWCRECAMCTSFAPSTAARAVEGSKASAPVSGCSIASNDVGGCQNSIAFDTPRNVLTWVGAGVKILSI
jgi:hypothetical protein